MVVLTGSGLRAPAQVLDVALDDPSHERFLEAAAAHGSAWCLLRARGVPVSVVTWDKGTDVRALIEDVRRRHVQMQPFSAPSSPHHVPDLTVVICTRLRAAGLARALTALAAQDDHDFDVLVVDNAPDEDPATRAVVDGASLSRLRYVHEPLPGLSRARNRALDEVRTELVAWLDDDEMADPTWIHWVRRGFEHASRPDAVCGLMLPAELETEAQVRFEQYGGFNKDRGFDPVVLRAGTDTVRSPLYPRPNFGAGGNMAFRTRALQAIGGFDNCLGAGTLSQGCEETKVLANLLRAGSTVLHWPPAITWHFHRRTMEELEQQFFGYSAGLSAFYVSMLRTSPSTIVDILSLVPRGVADFLAQRGHGGPGDLPDDFPPALLRASRRGILRGGGLYLRELRRQRREVSAPANRSGGRPV
jgi:GT2 family glycosyltransferase